MPSVPWIAAGDVEDRLDWLAMAEALAAGHRGPPARIADQVVTRGADTPALPAPPGSTASAPPPRR